MGPQLIRRADACDAQSISEIYNRYILNTTATFETEAIDQLEMRRRILEKVTEYDWLVAEDDRGIVGYAYYGVFRPRPAYAHTVESTIYLAEGSVGKGLGTLLYSNLIDSANEKGFRELIGVIALPNEASVRLHAKLGFREVGRLEGVGRKFERYIDVALWQRRTSRRAPDTGQ
jgi:phosphinothricin acetyltransferase